LSADWLPRKPQVEVGEWRSLVAHLLWEQRMLLKITIQYQIVSAISDAQNCVQQPPSKHRH
jgi:hypothetical protein